MEELHRLALLNINQRNWENAMDALKRCRFVDEFKVIGLIADINEERNQLERIKA